MYCRTQTAGQGPFRLNSPPLPHHPRCSFALAFPGKGTLLTTGHSTNFVLYIEACFALRELVKTLGIDANAEKMRQTGVVK